MTAVARVTKITAASSKSFQGAVTEYRATIEITFILEG